MGETRKPTGCFARNGEIYVGDSVEYDDGWLSFVAKIEERDGRFGFYLHDDLGFYRDDKEFTILKEDILCFAEDSTNEDFVILHPEHHQWYGIHAPLYGGASQALHEFEKRRSEDMEQQYFCLRLWDYSAPSFVSKSKAFYGTLADIRTFIGALEADKKTKEDFQETITAFHEFEAGNHFVTHNVAYQDFLLLKPVKIWYEAMLRLENHTWHHTNTWGYDHTLRCKSAVTRHIWIEVDGQFVRVVKAAFNTLQLQADNDLWAPLGRNLWGHPKILCTNEGSILNRLAVEEKRFENRDAAVSNFVQFYEEKDMDFSEFCNEIFGDG